MNIVFMGTPDFAVPSLRALIESGERVTGVFTQPDKPKGRGYQLMPPPVKELALTHNIPVFQPKGLRNEQALEDLKSCAPDLIVVAAYGKILPKAVLELPKYGCINVHASLLPKYRGAGPIQWAVLNGEAEAGVTTMQMAEGLDTGDMLEVGSTPVGENETASELHDRLSELGAEVLLRTLEKLKAGTLEPKKQDDALSCYAPMLDKSLSPIDFTKTAREVHNQIRGLSDWPAASTIYQGKRLKVYQSRLCEGNGKPGELIDHKNFVVACKEGAVQFVTVQYEGGKRMEGSAFLRGKRPNEEEILG